MAYTAFHPPPVPSASRPYRSVATLILILSTVAACVPTQPLATRPRPLPERIPGNVGGLLGEEIAPARSTLLGPIAYDLPIEANSWVEAEVEFLVRERRDVIDRWMERGDFYRDFVQEVFRENGLPTDLYHLALIESGFIPAARSPAGAVGVWQFMPATSGDVGLRVDAAVDERMDPVRSTRAAARHLRTLYRVHGDWPLAVAAYNAGSTRISRSLERSATVNFWDLAQRGDLAEETRRYVPRLFAMTIIGRDRERFGFRPRPAIRGFAFDSVYVEGAVPLGELAALGQASPDALAELNPHLLGGITPPGGYWVWVPIGSGVQLQRAYIASSLRATQRLEELASVPDPPRPPPSPAAAPVANAAYQVRAGDTLSGIASRHGVTVAQLQAANSLSGTVIRPGQRLTIPAAATGNGNSDSGKGAAAVQHVVSAGETLSGIASRNGITVAQLQAANSLTGVVIRPGQRLTIPAASGNGNGGSASGAATVQHVVRAGDTLWGIARQYGSTVESIREANRLGERSIVPGQALTIPL